MTYAVANGLVASGLILAGTFAAGMVVTVAAFPLLAVLLRSRLLPVMARTETWRGRIGHADFVLNYHHHPTRSNDGLTSIFGGYI